MTCEQIDKLPRDTRITVDFERFTRLPTDQKTVLNDWFEHAWKMREADPKDHYRAWMLAWDLFGYVAEIITGSADIDAWYPILLHHPYLQDRFEGVMSNKKSLMRMYVKRFSLSWPIFDIREIEQIHSAKTFSPIRATRVQEYLTLGATSFSPPCWKDHLNDLEFLPDWQHTLSVWHTVRMNLFRVDGWQHSESEVRIISNAFLSLIYFFKEGKIFFENPSLRPDTFDRTQVLSSL
jgi:hypothetical protein